MPEIGWSFINFFFLWFWLLWNGPFSFGMVIEKDLGQHRSNCCGDMLTCGWGLSSYSSMANMPHYCLDSIDARRIIKVNVDGFFSAKSNISGIGVILKDHDGRVLLKFCKQISADSSIHAEVLAVREDPLTLVMSRWVNYSNLSLSYTLKMLFRGFPILILHQLLRGFRILSKNVFLVLISISSSPTLIFKTLEMR